MGPSAAASEAAALTAEVGSVPLPAPFSPSRRSPSSSSSPGSTPAPVGLGLGRRGLGPQPLDLLGAAGQVGIGSREIGGVSFRVEVAVCEGGSHRQPTWSNCAVPPEEVKPPSPEAEMLNNVKNLHGFLYVADFRLLSDDEVDVNVGVDEVAVGAAAHGALDAHEAVLLGSLEDSLRV